jgi:hypothetical protein
MSKLTTILGSAAILVASNGVVKADTLLAGPLPVDISGAATGTITCAVTNVGANLQQENLELDIYDANFNFIDGVQCNNVGPETSCSKTVTFSNVSAPVPQSPFICRVFAGSTSADAPVRGSICGSVYPPGSTYCLQALINNGSSNGWTCGSNPNDCTNPP